MEKENTTLKRNGFTNEMEAVEQYWFDYDKNNWISQWPYDVVGQVSSAENATVGGDKIVDNDTSTRWSSEFSDDQWFVVDLGKSYIINKVTFNWEAAYAK